MDLRNVILLSEHLRFISREVEEALVSLTFSPVIDCFYLWIWVHVSWYWLIYIWTHVYSTTSASSLSCLFCVL